MRTENRLLEPEACAEAPELTPGRYVRITVSDTGAGIPEEIRDKIFEPFFSTKEPGKGTGLGLSAAFGIVKMHEGGIFLRNAQGGGTTFDVYLPASAEPPNLNQEPAPVGLGDRPRTILLVDDQPMVRDIARRILEKDGYSVLEAESGADAIRMFREEYRRISLVIVDLGAPGMDDGRLLRELAGIDPHVKTLISGGFSPDADSPGFPSDAVKGKVSKPFHMEGLLRAVRDALDGPRINPRRG